MDIPFSLSQGVSHDPTVAGNCGGLISQQPYVPVDDWMISMSQPYVPDDHWIMSPPPYVPADDWMMSISPPPYVPVDDWIMSPPPYVPVDNYSDRISQPPPVPVDDNGVWRSQPPYDPVDDLMPPPLTTDAYYGGDYFMPPLEGVSYDPALSLLSVDGCGDFQISPAPAIAYYGGGDQPPQPLEGVSYPMQSVGEPSSIAAVESGGGDEADDEDWKLSLPPGVKFRPIEEELIVDYLMPEFLNGSSNSRGIIKYADIYDYEPHQLQDLAYDHGDGNMYFYTRVKKIGKTKTERIIKSKKGYWKGTQAHKPIRGPAGNIVGTKTPLTYFIYKKKEEEKDIKTQWLMSEYRLKYHTSHTSSHELVLAVVYYHYHGKRSDRDDKEN